MYKACKHTQYDFLHSTCDSDGYVKGTRLICPNDAPNSKYLAIFDARDCFDKLREAFVVQRDGCGFVFLSALRHVLDTTTLTPELRNIANDMVHAVSALSAPREEIAAPIDFAVRAWPSYVKCLRHAEYYMSVEELLVAAAINNVSIVIFEAHNDVLRICGSVGIVDHHTVFVKITGDRNERVRSHFERLLLDLIVAQLKSGARHILDLQNQRSEPRSPHVTASETRQF